ncbi:MAG: SURF1 family protein, partial [Myxococcales bacterium]
MRFLLSRRWFFFTIAVAFAAWGAVLLGQWQFHRLEDRKHENAVITHNLKADPVAIGEVMSTDEPTTHDEEWKLVTMTGTYDDEHTIVLKYQTRDSKSGVDVVTPLVGADGTAVLVDRGWLATNNRGN